MTSRLRAPLVALSLLALAAVAAPLLPLPDPVAIDVAHRFAPPSLAHLLGQDEFGRDELARLVWGARTSLAVALASTAIACVVGTALGLLGGYLRGVTEFLTVRSMDVVLCFPPLLLAVLVVTLAGPGAATLIGVLSVLFLPAFVRVTYAGVLSASRLDYVEALRVLGASNLRIMLRAVLPNVAGPILVQASLAAAAAVVLEAGLSFLGLGVVPPTPSWGLMVRAARTTMEQAPVLLMLPCIALTATIFTLNALCDALQAWLDPHADARALWRRALGLPAAAPHHSAAVLDVRGLTVELATPGGKVRPVRDIAFQVHAGETLAVVGESGSGKSLTGLAVLGLLPGIAQPVAGSATFEGQDLLRLPEPAMRRLRGGKLAMVFQDPSGSLNPVHRIGDQIEEAVAAHAGAPGSAAKCLTEVGIPDPTARARAYPHQLSGGMRQRAMIAMAVANRPRLLIADEPTTALDVTVQAQIIDLLRDLQQASGLGMLFITHNLPLVAEIADRVAVMYAGEIVEQGTTAELFARPLHPYTRALIDSALSETIVSRPGERATFTSIRGTVPPPNALPPGCLFAPRCDLATSACESTHPALREIGESRATRCIRWQELAA